MEVRLSRSRKMLLSLKKLAKIKTKCNSKRTSNSIPLKLKKSTARMRSLTSERQRWTSSSRELARYWSTRTRDATRAKWTSMHTKGSHSNSNYATNS